MYCRNLGNHINLTNLPIKKKTQQEKSLKKSSDD